MVVTLTLIYDLKPGYIFQDLPMKCTTNTFVRNTFATNTFITPKMEGKTMSEACSDLDMPVLVLDGSDWPVLVLDALIGHSILSGSERTHISQQ